MTTYYTSCILRTYIWTSTNNHTYIHTYLHRHTYVLAHIHLHTYTQMYTHAQTHVHTHPAHVHSISIFQCIITAVMCQSTDSEVTNHRLLLLATLCPQAWRTHIHTPQTPAHLRRPQGRVSHTKHSPGNHYTRKVKTLWVSSPWTHSLSLSLSLWPAV